MGYQAYPEYKEARLEWLGNLPKHWECLRLRLLSKRYSGGTPDKKNDFYWQDGTIPWLNSGAVNQGIITQPSGFISELGLKESSAKWVPADAVIIALAGQGKTKGTAAITEIKTTCNQSMAAIIFENDHPKYMYWWLHSQYKKIRGMASDDGRDGLNLEMIGSIPCPRPNKGEQLKIAHFLDYKTAQIDRLIEKKQELIEKLQEQRIATITQAVTKGLDYSVPMKDSGEAWLGEVPAQWGVKPVKYLSKILRGKFTHRPRNDPAFYDGDYPFIQTGDIARAGKYLTEYSQTLNEKGLSVSKEFPAGTLIMTIAANIGDMAILDFDACFPDSIVGFAPEIGIDLNFLFYMFAAMKKRLMSTAVLNTQLNLNIDRISAISTVHPDFEEQKQIARFLDLETSRIDNVSSKIADAIFSLKQYRTALITAAVTGQIDVRDWQAPAAAEASEPDMEVA